MVQLATINSSPSGLLNLPPTLGHVSNAYFGGSAACSRPGRSCMGSTCRGPPHPCRPLGAVRGLTSGRSWKAGQRLVCWRYV